MSVFIQPPFWASEYRRRTAPHAISKVVVEPTIEPLTIDEGKAYARDDQYDAGLMDTCIRAARQKVELDTGLALLTQTRDISYDYVYSSVLTLPAQSMPLQSVTSIKTTDTSGVINTLATDQYLVDTAGGRISLSQTGVWPTDLRTFQPWVIRIVCGWTSPALIPPMLKHAVGLLAGHYANTGRDVAIVGAGIAAVAVPYGYDDTIGPWVSVSLA